MRLAYPLFLLLLLLIPALLYLRHHHRRKPKITYSDTHLLRNLPQGWAVRFRFILPLCYALALFSLIIALCRPQRGLSESRVNTSALDIVLTVDVSTSMRAEDFATLTQQHLNRLDAAKEVIRRFILDRPDDRIGLIAFAALPYTVAPLTLDHAWLVGRLEDLQTGMLEDGTAIGDALASAINRLRDSEAKSKIVILLTDGMNNTGKLSPINAAEAAHALGIRVYTIGAGATGLVRYPVPSAFGGTQYVRQQSDIDETTLTRIAETTGGLYFRARDLGELEKVYEEIDRLEKTEITMHQFTRYEERFLPFLLAALLLLLAEKFLSSTRLGRLP